MDWTHSEVGGAGVDQAASALFPTSTYWPFLQWQYEGSLGTPLIAVVTTRLTLLDLSSTTWLGESLPNSYCFFLPCHLLEGGKEWSVSCQHLVTDKALSLFA